MSFLANTYIQKDVYRILSLRVDQIRRNNFVFGNILQADLDFIYLKIKIILYELYPKGRLKKKIALKRNDKNNKDLDTRLNNWNSSIVAPCY